MKREISPSQIVAIVAVAVVLLALAGWFFIGRNGSQYVETKPVLHDSRAGLSKFKMIQAQRTGGGQ